MVEQKHERYVNPYTDFGFKKPGLAKEDINAL